jgi:hypothetical protein
VERKANGKMENRKNGTRKISIGNKGSREKGSRKKRQIFRHWLTRVRTVRYSLFHGRKSWGDGGTNPPRIGSGGTLIQVVPPDFCHVSKFQALAMDSSPPPRFQPGFTPLSLL